MFLGTMVIHSLMTNPFKECCHVGSFRLDRPGLKRNVGIMLVVKETNLQVFVFIESMFSRYLNRSRSLLWGGITGGGMCHCQRSQVL